MFHSFCKQLARWIAALEQIAEQHSGVLSVSARPAPDQRAHTRRLHERPEARANDTANYAPNAGTATPIPPVQPMRPVQH